MRGEPPNAALPDTCGRKGLGSMGQGNGLCTLVVDDEPMIREAAAALLASEGYRVLEAANGRQALTLFAAGGITLVVLDLMLPDVSGEDVCRLMRCNSCVPIKMLTAKPEESDLWRGLPSARTTTW